MKYLGTITKTNRRIEKVTSRISKVLHYTKLYTENLAIKSNKKNDDGNRREAGGNYIAPNQQIIKLLLIVILVIKQK